jgi:hypothetical protein
VSAASAVEPLEQAGTADDQANTTSGPEEYRGKKPQVPSSGFANRDRSTVTATVDLDVQTLETQPNEGVWINEADSETDSEVEERPHPLDIPGSKYDPRNDRPTEPDHSENLGDVDMSAPDHNVPVVFAEGHEINIVDSDLGKILPKTFTPVYRHFDRFLSDNLACRIMYRKDEWEVRDWERVNLWSTYWHFSFGREIRSLPLSLVTRAFHDMNLDIVRCTLTHFTRRCQDMGPRRLVDDQGSRRANAIYNPAQDVDVDLDTISESERKILVRDLVVHDFLESQNLQPINHPEESARVCNSVGDYLGQIEGTVPNLVFRKAVAGVVYNSQEVLSGHMFPCHVVLLLGVASPTEGESIVLGRNASDEVICTARKTSTFRS